MAEHVLDEPLRCFNPPPSEGGRALFSVGESLRRRRKAACTFVTPPWPIAASTASLAVAKVAVAVSVPDETSSTTGEAAASDSEHPPAAPPKALNTERDSHRALALAFIREVASEFEKDPPIAILCIVVPVNESDNREDAAKHSSYACVSCFTFDAWMSASLSDSSVPWRSA